MKDRDMDQAPALRLEDVTFRYLEKGRRNILDHVSLDIEAGKITVLMGSSGCGKSTLAAVAAGLYPENGGVLETGTIKLFGHPVQEMNEQERASYLTLMFQNPDLQFCMNTLRAEMRFCMENICIPPSEMDTRIQEASRVLGTEALLDRNLTTLSGGEKQKAALCCLYVMESRAILLDEAFANIDPRSAGELISMLRLAGDRGRTVIAVDHQVDRWVGTADEIIVLGEGGRVLQRGIRPEKAGEYASLFEQEGLFLPGKYFSGREKRKPVGTDIAVRLRDVTVYPFAGEEKKRKKAPERPAPLLLGASADFPRGAMTALVGPSGSGKTTTFLAVLKQHPFEGQIQINGKDIRQMKESQVFSQAGIVFQNPSNQFVTQNVEEEIGESLRIWGKEKSEEKRRETADTLLESYGLQRYRRYSPYMLSQGQQRRLAVLAALAGGQGILLLDEPTYGQDYRSTMAIMEQLKEKVDQEGLTVVFITHDRLLARAWADKIYMLEDQSLKEWGDLP